MKWEFKVENAIKDFNKKQKFEIRIWNQNLKLKFDNSVIWYIDLSKVRTPQTNAEGKGWTPWQYFT